MAGNMREGQLDTGRQQAVIMGISLLLFLGMLGACVYMQNRESGKVQKVYPVVCMGDSILAIKGEDSSITSLMEDQLGVRVFNGALGGTSMSRQRKDRSMAYQKDGLSMAALSLAIGYRDFGVQNTIRIQEAGTEYFSETLEELEQIDFSQTQVLLIEHGINDYNAGIPIIDEENLYNMYTFTGALRLSVTTLQKKYPKMRIVLVTPTYCWFLAAQNTCEEWNSGYGVLEDYVKAEKMVAAELGIDVIDVYHNFYPHETWEDWKQYTVDGLHPNDEGRQLLADKIVSCLKEIL